MNMTAHELVDPFEQKDIPYSDQKGIRIPLSLGEPREDFDRKGNICQVYDVIWNPGTVKKAKTEVLFRSGMIELAFAYVKEKHKHTLNMRWSIPKMKYKGDTVQF